MITLKSIKVYLNKEEKRLKQRTLENGTVQENASLQGSLMTIKKIKSYINGEK